MARIPKSASMHQKKHNLGDMSMPIDVDAYVDHFYIHYKQQSAQHLAAPAAAWYKYKTQLILDDMKASGAASAAQAQALIAQMNQDTTAARSSVQIIKALSEGPLMEETLDSIAAAMNNLLMEKYSSVIDGGSYEEAVTNISNQYNSMLLNGPVDDTSKFFDYIKQALDLVNARPNKSELRAFAALQKVFEGKTTYNDVVSLVSLNTIGIASQVIGYLSTAAKNLSANGSVSTQSFASTIANIFSRAIGEPLAERMMKNVLFEISNNADQAFDSLIAQSGGKLTWDRGTIPTTKQSGTAAGAQSGRTAKVDIISNGLFNLGVTLQNGTTATIEIATNASIKWQSAKSKNIHIVSRTPLRTFLENESPDRQQYAYNIIAHRLSGGGRKGGFYQAYNAIRSTIAASFFNEWISGSGEQLVSGGSPIGGLDRAQFLMYNGKIYSIVSIVNRICANTLKGLSTEIRGFSTSDSKIDNSFVAADGKPEWAPDIEAANVRSQMVRDVINTLTISASLNSNILKSLF